ncbi:GGDEF domain-containing protein [Breznakiella homolactica]|uniref:diguanylate cyclase n=1 Tax=Breznakiella homolactica TaxID=2798577 RepID=A0A7T7XLG1_9SPIR|nr:GGDEF domain-containing protein [Breznakiella homolactica]QQO08471.1 GGDEF domain-containing protein [Breznakiella homolactica]
MELIHTAVTTLFDLDTKTLIGVLVWGNIAAAVLIQTFQSHNLSTTDIQNIKRMTLIRIFYAIGYILLFLRGVFPDILSVNAGNTILYICFYMEASLLLTMMESDSRVLSAVLKITLAAVVLSFNIFEFMYKDPSLRITMASISIFAILVTPTIKLLFSKKVSKFKHAIGFFYVILLLTIIPRSILPLVTGDVSLHTNNLYQTLFFIAQILMMVSGTIINLLFMKEKNDKIIETMAKTDSLTSIANRHCFLQEATVLFNICREQKKELTLLFFDLDHFKMINDRYGHQFGDEVLKTFTNILKQSLRNGDLSCRYGGEEFIAIVQNPRENLGELIAERIRNEVKHTSFEMIPGFRFTVSIGMISSVPGQSESLSDFIQKGDMAMYEAKKSGRDKTVVYSC